MEKTTIECTFDPQKSELKDIFANKHARAIWSIYRRSHIISGDGLEVLNTWCRNLLEDDKFDYEEAKTFAERLQYAIAEVEFARIDKNSKFVDEVIPYLLDQKEVVLTIKKNDRQNDEVIT